MDTCQDAWPGAVVVKKLLTCKSVDNQVITDLPALWKGLAEAILATPNRKERSAIFETTIAGMLDAEEIRKAVFSADLDAEISAVGGMPGLITADYILATEWPEPDWVIPQILPVGLTTLAGRPKGGKSWLN